MAEQLKITEAWEYFTRKTGIEISRRAFLAWIENEGIEINEQFFDLTPNGVNGTYWIAREKIDALIQAMKP